VAGIFKILSYWNTERLSISDLLSFRTTLAGEAVPQSVSIGPFERATEYGISVAQGPPIEALVLGYDRHDWDKRSSFTWTFWRDATIDQVRTVFEAILHAATTGCRADLDSEYSEYPLAQQRSRSEDAMATAENRDLIGLHHPVAADRWTATGQQWIKANFDAAKSCREPPGASEFDPDPPGAPNRGYRGTTEFDTPTIRVGRAGFRRH
jgi:hypothetical protein